MPDPATTDERASAARGGAARAIRRILLLLVAGGLLLGHLETLARGPEYSGPLLLVDHVFDLTIALVAVVIFLATGRWLLRRTALEPAHPLDAVLYSLAAGPGVWALVLLGVGLAGALNALVLLALLLGSLLLFREEIWELPALARRATERVTVSDGDRALIWLAGFVAVLLSLFLLLNGSAPPGDWDSLMYHLEVPRQWLSAGRIHLLEGNLHVAYTSLFQILYIPFLALGSNAAPALLNGLFALALGLSVYRVGERFFDSSTGVISAAVLWASTGLLLVAVTARVDTTLAFYVILGQGAVAAALVERDGARENLILSALVMGFAAAMKYHALAFTVVLAPVGLWALWSRVADRRARMVTLAVASGVFLAGLLPWMLKNQILTGAPFYPFLGQPILPPWLQELFGVQAVPTGLEERVFGSLGRSREPFDLVSLFLTPGRLTVEAEGIHYHTNVILLLVPLWVLHFRRVAVNALALPPILYFVGVTTGLETINLRYLFPALPALTVVTTWFLVDAVGRMPWAAARRTVLIAIAVAVLIPTTRSALQWTAQRPVIAQAAGQVSRQEYLQRGYPLYSGIAGTVNRGVPEGGKVLLLWEARGFYLAPDHLQDNILSNWPLLSAYLERDSGCLEGSDITHVLAANALARYYASRGADPRRLDLEGFRSFAGRCMEPIQVGPAFGLYRLRKPGDGSSDEGPP